MLQPRRRRPREIGEQDVDHRRNGWIGFGSRKVFFEAVEKFLQCIASDGHLKMFLWLKSRRSSRP